MIEAGGTDAGDSCPKLVNALVRALWRVEWQHGEQPDRQQQTGWWQSQRASVSELPKQQAVRMRAVAFTHLLDRAQAPVPDQPEGDGAREQANALRLAQAFLALQGERPGAGEALTQLVTAFSTAPEIQLLQGAGARQDWDRPVRPITEHQRILSLLLSLRGARPHHHSAPARQHAVPGGAVLLGMPPKALPSPTTDLWTSQAAWNAISFTYAQTQGSVTAGPWGPDVWPDDVALGVGLQHPAAAMGQLPDMTSPLYGPMATVRRAAAVPPDATCTVTLATPDAAPKPTAAAARSFMAGLDPGVLDMDSDPGTWSLLCEAGGGANGDDGSLPAPPTPALGKAWAPGGRAGSPAEQGWPAPVLDGAAAAAWVVKGRNATPVAALPSPRSDIDAVRLSLLALRGTVSAIDMLAQGTIRPGTGRRAATQAALDSVLAASTLRLRLAAFLQHHANPSGATAGLPHPPPDPDGSTLKRTLHDHVTAAFISCVTELATEHDAVVLELEQRWEATGALGAPGGAGLPDTLTSTGVEAGYARHSTPAVTLLQLLVRLEPLTARLQLLCSACGCVAAPEVADITDGATGGGDTTGGSLAAWRGSPAWPALQLLHAAPAEGGWGLAHSEWMEDALGDGLDLLDRLYSGLQQACGPAAPLLRRLFTAAAAPLLADLRLWAFGSPAAGRQGHSGTTPGTPPQLPNCLTRVTYEVDVVGRQQRLLEALSNRTGGLASRFSRIWSRELGLGSVATVGKTHGAPGATHGAPLLVFDPARFGGVSDATTRATHACWAETDAVLGLLAQQREATEAAADLTAFARAQEYEAQQAEARARKDAAAREAQAARAAALAELAAAADAAVAARDAAREAERHEEHLVLVAAAVQEHTEALALVEEELARGGGLTRVSGARSASSGSAAAVSSPRASGGGGSAARQPRTWAERAAPAGAVGARARAAHAEWRLKRLALADERAALWQGMAAHELQELRSRTAVLTRGALEPGSWAAAVRLPQPSVSRPKTDLPQPTTTVDEASPAAARVKPQPQDSEPPEAPQAGLSGSNPARASAGGQGAGVAGQAWKPSPPSASPASPSQQRGTPVQPKPVISAADMPPAGLPSRRASSTGGQSVLAGVLDGGGQLASAARSQAAGPPPPGRDNLPPLPRVGRHARRRSSLGGGHALPVEYTPLTPRSAVGPVAGSAPPRKSWARPGEGASAAQAGGSGPGLGPLHTPDWVDAMAALPAGLRLPWEPAAPAQEGGGGGQRAEEQAVPVSTVLEVCVALPLLAHYRITTAATWRLLTQHMGFLDCCAALRRYFFFESGDFAARLLAGLLAVWQPLEGGISAGGGAGTDGARAVITRWGIASQQLPSALAEALATCDDPHAARLRLRRAPPGRDVFGRSPTAGPSGLGAGGVGDAMLLFYEVPWPSCEVLCTRSEREMAEQAAAGRGTSPPPPAPALSGYADVASGLMRLRACIAALQRAWLVVGKPNGLQPDSGLPVGLAAAGAAHGPLGLPPSAAHALARRLAACRAWVHAALHFLGALQRHAASCLHGVCWEKFRAAVLGGPMDVVQLAQAHDAYVSAAANACFLNPGQGEGEGEGSGASGELQACVAAAVGACEAFAALAVRFTEGSEPRPGAVGNGGAAGLYPELKAAHMAVSAAVQRVWRLLEQGCPPDAAGLGLASSLQAELDCQWYRRQQQYGGRPAAAAVHAFHG